MVDTDRQRAHSIGMSRRKANHATSATPHTTSQPAPTGWVSAAAGATAGLIVRPGTLAAPPPGGEKQLIVHGTTPMNAEPELGKLVHSWETPIKHFYVRSHAPVPQVDLDSFRLTVEGLVTQKLSLSIAEMVDRFPTAEITATMTCAGNRRSEHSRVKKVGGVQWGAGPIGNARWGGVRLADVLRLAGLKEGAKHVWFESIAQVKKSSRTFPFGASIPIEKSLERTQLGNGPLLANNNERWAVAARPWISDSNRCPRLCGRAQRQMARTDCGQRPAFRKPLRRQRLQAGHQRRRRRVGSCKTYLRVSD